MPEEPNHCSGCGRPFLAAGGAGLRDDATCDGTCRGTLEPARFCAACGRRMAVQVTPTGWRGRCRGCGVEVHG